MKISRSWLQTFFDAPLPEIAGLAEAFTFHAFEIDGVEGDILDVKVTPNRGHDCLSHRGLAKEISAILRMPLRAEKDPLAHAPDMSKKTDALRVEIENAELCPRFTAALITGVSVGPSPEWLQKSLEAIGQRSINNVVDATNWVMFNMGQPLHAFDAGRLVEEGGAWTLRVRSSRSGETMLGLDDKEYALSEAMTIIANGGEAVSVAGVKGGKPTGIDGSTKTVILEAANWNAPMIRKTSQALKLRTDASARFEQVISPELAPYGLAQCADIVCTIAGGKVEGFVDEYPRPVARKNVSFTVEEVNDCLGTAFAADVIEDVLKRLSISFTKDGGSFTVSPPLERLDIAIPEDMIEEIGRIVGYDAVPEKELSVRGTPSVHARFVAMERARERFIREGFSEVITSVFSEQGETEVLNKVGGERSHMRESLIPGLTEALQKNMHVKDVVGVKKVNLFEIGEVWKEGEEITMVGVAREGAGVEEQPLEVASADEYDNFPTSSLDRYKPFSRYPAIVRDVSFWAPQGTSEEDLRGEISRAAGDLLERIELFDRFEKGEKVSYAFRLVFQSFERTLTDAEVHTVMERVAAALTSRGYSVR